jgi:DNA repair exonuclease SbcCD nuclease subunit
MSTRPFRFIHASDFHLERPLMGVAEVPDHLRELFLDAPYRAAARLFEAVEAENAQFVILSGDLLDPLAAGPRGTLFLLERFRRLAERGTDVYWAGGVVDPPDAWPAALALPQNVHVFPQSRVEQLTIQRDGEPLAHLAGMSRDRQRPLRPADFAADPAGLYSIAVTHGEIDAAALPTGGIHYWALGGRHDRSTLLGGPQMVHYCGSPQGRRPGENGVHGCTLVQVDAAGQTRTSLIDTDAARWASERIAVDETTSREELEMRLRDRLHALVEAAPALDLLISWTVAGHGSLLGQLRKGALAAELLGWLRNDFGFVSPAAWSVSLGVEMPETLPPEWYEQETIRGDFLRAVRQLQMNADEPLVLDSYLAEAHLAGTLAAAAAVGDKPARDRVLREAAALGADLLSGEEPDA